jgi:hypothetical protein
LSWLDPRKLVIYTQVRILAPKNVHPVVRSKPKQALEAKGSGIYHIAGAMSHWILVSHFELSGTTA